MSLLPEYAHQANSGDAVVAIPDGAWLDFYAVTANDGVDSGIIVTPNSGVGQPPILVKKGTSFNYCAGSAAPRVLYGPLSIEFTGAPHSWVVAYWVS